MIGTLEAREGLYTTAGKITRVSDKSVWAAGKSGVEQMYRKHDGRLPSIPVYRLSIADRKAAGLID